MCSLSLLEVDMLARRQRMYRPLSGVIVIVIVIVITIVLQGVPLLGQVRPSDRAAARTRKS